MSNVVACIKCPSPRKQYSGKGPRPKYCNSCDIPQQKKNTAIQKKVRRINEDIQPLYDKILMGDYRSVIFNELNYLLERRDRIMKGEKVAISCKFDLHILDSNSNELLGGIIIKQLNFRKSHN